MRTVIGGPSAGGVYEPVRDIRTGFPLAQTQGTIRGCGSLDVGSSAWVVCKWRRLLTGGILLCRRGASAELRLAGVARPIGPDLK